LRKTHYSNIKQYKDDKYIYCKKTKMATL
jgi:hypothetical protein